MALATTDDYEEITGEALDEGDTARVSRLLEIASAAVLASAHGQTIIEASTTVDLAPGAGGVIRFPQRPVTAVASVTLDGSVLSASDYRWTEGGNGQPAYLIRRCLDRDAAWSCPVTVAYTHGWATVPEPIVAALVMLAQQAKNVGDAGGRQVVSTSKAIDDYTTTTTYRQAGGLDMAIPTWVQATLDLLTKVDGPTSIAVVRERP